MPKKIALIGGGTGGHVTPIISLISYIRSTGADAEFIWIGESDSMESRFARDNDIHFESISVYRIPAMRDWWRFPGAIMRLLIGMGQSYRILRSFRPDVLFSKGWPGAISVVLMARLLSIPIYLHDSDVIPGASNRFTSRFADLIFLGCSEAKEYFPHIPTETVGQILDPVLLDPKDSDEMTHFISPDKTRVFVICGSQGSKAIYSALLSQLPELQDFEFIIALGTKNEIFAKQFAQFSNVRALPWVEKENTAFLFREADIVISRGSVTTLAEAAVFGAKIIAIPLPIAAFDHQRANVRSYEAQGLCIGLDESDLGELTDLLRAHAGQRAYVTPRYDVLEGTKKVAQRLLK